MHSRSFTIAAGVSILAVVFTITSVSTGWQTETAQLYLSQKRRADGVCRTVGDLEIP